MQKKKVVLHIKNYDKVVTKLQLQLDPLLKIITL